MAELGAIASIIGIIGAGAKLSLVLFDFGNGIGSAGSQVRAIGTEISLFCAVLKQLERTLAKAKDRRYSISAIDTTQEILEQCQVVFDELQAIFDGLIKSKSSSGETSMDILGRLKWAMKRDKVQMHRATLESCKITLHIMLTTLDFAERVSMRRISTSETDLEDEQEEIMTRSLVIAQKCAVDRLEKLENEEDKYDEHINKRLEHSNGLCTTMAEAQPPCLEDYVINPMPNSSVADGTSVRSASSLSGRESRRTSLWLHDLIPEATASLYPRSQSREGVSTSSPEVRRLSLLLWKWTDQGGRWDQMHKSKETGLGSRVQLDVGPKGEPLVYPEDLPQTLPAIRYTSETQDKMRWPSSPRRANRPSPPSFSKDAAVPSPPITPRSPNRPRAFTRATAAHKEMLATPPDSPKPILSPEGTTMPSVAGQMFQNFPVHREESCEKLLPSILKRYDISDDWRNYAIYIAFEDQERRVGLNESPLALQSRLCREGKKARFMLRKLSSVAMDSPSLPGGLI